MLEKNVLTIGTEIHTQEYLKSIYPDFIFININALAKFEALFESNDNDQYLFVAVGPDASFLTIPELAQGLRSILPNKKIFYFASHTKGFERSDFIKNGFDDAFLTNIDGKLIKDEIVRIIDNSKNLKPVKLIDIEPDSIVDFNIVVFLPLNKKYIRYVSAGEVFEKHRLEKLIRRGMGVIFVPDSELTKFYEYSAKRLRSLKTGQLSETEKQQKMQVAVRNIFLNLFEDKIANDYELGKETIEQCKKMIATVVSPNGDPNWIDNLLKNIKSVNSDIYDHSTNVSIYATLFAMALGLPFPEDFAVAGLFHDVGKDNLQMELQNKNEALMTPEEFEEYKKHPDRSIELLKEKK